MTPLSAPPTPLAPGTRVRVTQKLVCGAAIWETRVEGEVLAHRYEPTGSWFAHGKNDRLWLERIHLRKPDGEITVLSLDPNSVVEVLAENR